MVGLPRLPGDPAVNGARLVGAEGEVLEIRVPGREGIAGDSEGPLRLRALAIVSAPGFSAEVPTSLTWSDVAALTHEWSRIKTADVNLGLWFVPLEPAIVLHLVHEDGLVLHGRLIHPLGYGNVLTFSLRTDEEALAAFLTALGAAAEAAANSPTPDLHP